MMPQILAFLIVSTSSAWAGSAHVCTPEGQDLSPIPSDLQKALLHSASGYHAVTPEQVLQAPCTRKAPFSLSEMEAYLKRLESKERNTGRARDSGFEYENESPALWQALEALGMQAHHIQRPYADLDPSLPRPPMDRIPPGCKRASCAAKAWFGQKEGTQLLFMKARFGVNGSHFSFPQSEAFTAQELDQVLWALSDLPDTVLPLPENQRLTRYPRGYEIQDNTLKPHEHVTATAAMEVTDVWAEAPAGDQRSTIIHEVAHQLAARVKADQSGEWLRLSDWKELTSEYVKGQKVVTAWQSNSAAMVSEYGSRSPLEDFAESVVAYRYNGEEFKRNFPKKYAFVRETIFDGVEYLSEETCRNPKLISNQVAAKATQLLESMDVTSREALQEVQTWCREAVQGILKDTFKAGTPDSKVSPISQDPRFAECFKGGLEKYARYKARKSETFEFARLTGEVLTKRERLSPVSVPPGQVKRVSEVSLESLRDVLGQLARASSAVWETKAKDYPWIKDPCEGWVVSAAQAAKEAGVYGTLLSESGIGHGGSAADGALRGICKRSYKLRPAEGPRSESEIKEAIRQVVK